MVGTLPDYIILCKELDSHALEMVWLAMWVA